MGTGASSLHAGVAYAAVRSRGGGEERERSRSQSRTRRGGQDSDDTIMNMSLLSSSNDLLGSNSTANWVVDESMLRSNTTLHFVESMSSIRSFADFGDDTIHTDKDGDQPTSTTFALSDDEREHQTLTQGRSDGKSRKISRPGNKKQDRMDAAPTTGEVKKKTPSGKKTPKKKVAKTAGVTNKKKKKESTDKRPTGASRKPTKKKSHSGAVAEAKSPKPKKKGVKKKRKSSHGDCNHNAEGAALPKNISLDVVGIGEHETLADGTEDAILPQHLEPEKALNPMGIEEDVPALINEAFEPFESDSFDSDDEDGSKARAFRCSRTTIEWAPGELEELEAGDEEESITDIPDASDVESDVAEREVMQNSEVTVEWDQLEPDPKPDNEEFYDADSECQPLAEIKSNHGTVYSESPNAFDIELRSGVDLEDLSAMQDSCSVDLLSASKMSLDTLSLGSYDLGMDFVGNLSALNREVDASEHRVDHVASQPGRTWSEMAVKKEASPVVKHDDANDESGGVVADVPPPPPPPPTAASTPPQDETRDGAEHLPTNLEKASSRQVDHAVAAKSLPKQTSVATTKSSEHSTEPRRKNFGSPTAKTKRIPEKKKPKKTTAAPKGKVLEKKRSIVQKEPQKREVQQADEQPQGAQHSSTHESTAAVPPTPTSPKFKSVSKRKSVEQKASPARTKNKTVPKKKSDVPKERQKREEKQGLMRNQLSSKSIDVIRKPKPRSSLDVSSSSMPCSPSAGRSPGVSRRKRVKGKPKKQLSQDQNGKSPKSTTRKTQEIPKKQDDAVAVTSPVPSATKAAKAVVTPKQKVGGVVASPVPVALPPPPPSSSPPPVSARSPVRKSPGVKKKQPPKQMNKASSVGALDTSGSARKSKASVTRISLMAAAADASVKGKHTAAAGAADSGMVKSQSLTALDDLVKKKKSIPKKKPDAASEPVASPSTFSGKLKASTTATTTASRKTVRSASPSPKRKSMKKRDATGMRKSSSLNALDTSGHKRKSRASVIRKNLQTSQTATTGTTYSTTNGFDDAGKETEGIFNEGQIIKSQSLNALDRDRPDVVDWDEPSGTARSEGLIKDRPRRRGSKPSIVLRSGELKSILKKELKQTPSSRDLVPAAPRRTVSDEGSFLGSEDSNSKHESDYVRKSRNDASSLSVGGSGHSTAKLPSGNPMYDPLEVLMPVGAVDTLDPSDSLDWSTSSNGNDSRPSLPKRTSSNEDVSPGSRDHSASVSVEQRRRNEKTVCRRIVRRESIAKSPSLGALDDARNRLANSGAAGGNYKEEATKNSLGNLGSIRRDVSTGTDTTAPLTDCSSSSSVQRRTAPMTPARSMSDDEVLAAMSQATKPQLYFFGAPGLHSSYVLRTGPKYRNVKPQKGWKSVFSS